MEPIDELGDDEQEEHSLAGSDQLEYEPSSWGPRAPDGGPSPEMVHLGPPAPAREFTADNVPCLRDCRYYFATIGHYGAGNRGGFNEATIRIHHCTFAGISFKMSADEPVYECNQWDPHDERLVELRADRRDRWYAAHNDKGDPDVERKPSG